jgi:hypothetical protein
MLKKIKVSLMLLVFSVLGLSAMKLEALNVIVINDTFSPITLESNRAHKLDFFKKGLQWQAAKERKGTIFQTAAQAIKEAVRREGGVEEEIKAYALDKAFMPATYGTKSTITLKPNEAAVLVDAMPGEILTWKRLWAKMGLKTPLQASIKEAVSQNKPVIYFSEIAYPVGSTGEITYVEDKNLSSFVDKQIKKQGI